jgi:hypothetical protein
MRFIVGWNCWAPDSERRVASGVRIKNTVASRRAENLRAMRSPASFALAGIMFLAVLVAFVFYDRPITNNSVVLSYLQGLSGTIR